MFGLRKVDDVRKYVVARTITKGDKTFYKAPKIQRLVTERRIRRKKLDKRNKQDRFKAGKDALENYEKVLSQYAKEKKAAKESAKKDAAKEVAAQHPMLRRQQRQICLRGIQGKRDLEKKEKFDFGKVLADLMTDVDIRLVKWEQERLRHRKGGAN